MKAGRLLDAESAPIFAPPNYVLFARQGAVLAQQIDLDMLQTVGDPLPVARQVATPQGTVGSVALSAAPAGLIAYRADGGDRQMRWVDRAGRQIAVLGGPDSSEPTAVRLSSDGRMVAVYRMVNGNSDGWLFETARDVRQRLTTNPAREFDPVWAPDGSRIIFGSTRQGVVDLYERTVGSAATETLVWESSESKNGLDWSLDGKWILFAVQSARTARDLWALPVAGERKPIAVASTAANEPFARFSRTAAGLPISRTRADGTKSTFNAFSNPAAGRRSRPTAARFPSGSVTESRCSIWTPATALRAWPCCRRARASSQEIQCHCSRCR